MTVSNDSIAMNLPLSQLRIDAKSNVRHVNRGLDPVLLASIRAIGLRSPLNVRKNGQGYVIFAGGQRYLALQEIAKADKTPDMLVPVIVTQENDAVAREASLHENVARSAMHPVDEYRAYDLLANDKDNPMSLAQIAERFGVSERGVKQRLALGALDASVLDAYSASEIDAKLVKLFTLERSKKAQKAALERARTGHLNAHSIREALGLNDSHRTARMLQLVTEAAYEAQGGKIARDLFADEQSDNTQISDMDLLTAMVDELIDKEVARLTAEGWGIVQKTFPNDIWSYSSVKVGAVEPTKEEAKRLAEIDKVLEAAEEADDYPDDGDKLEDERNAILEAQQVRAFAALTPAARAKCIAFVRVNHSGTAIEIEYKQQPGKSSASAATSATGDKAKAVKPEDAVSQALMIRQAEQLTAATSAAILKQPHAAIAALIAAIGSAMSSDAITIRSTRPDHKAQKFDSVLAAALKMTTAQQIEALTKIVSQNVNLVQRFAKKPVLEFSEHKALADAIDGKALTAATREAFDAADYFGSVSRATIVQAVREAMGDAHASNVEKMGKADAAKFATANLPKLKWLPKQLRVAAYDGPVIAKKAKAPAKSAPAKAAKKPAAKKAKAKR
jgi:ParB family chromosome partitioning protein